MSKHVDLTFWETLGLFGFVVFFVAAVAGMVVFERWLWRAL